MVWVLSGSGGVGLAWLLGLPCVNIVVFYFLLLGLSCEGNAVTQAAAVWSCPIRVIPPSSGCFRWSSQVIVAVLCWVGRLPLCSLTAWLAHGRGALATDFMLC